MDKLREGLRGVAEAISLEVKDRTILGLGSGSTVATLLEELSPMLVTKGVTVSGVPTSGQIEMVATRTGIQVIPFSGAVDLAIDGADQVDANLDLIKGGGGALLKEKVLMSSAKQTAIVAGQDKFVRMLGEKGTRVPVEVFPMARVPAKRRLAELGGVPEERLLPKGYPFYTENGNIILDTRFEPIGNPSGLETEIKRIPGVAEVGIFTFKPIRVYKVKPDGTFQVLHSEA